jgi:FRG domain
MTPFQIIKTTSWQDVSVLARRLTPFVFRGQKEESWKLTTTLERSWEVGRLSLVDRQYAERNVLDSFRRRAHQFIANSPDDAAVLDWLALLQHHGGPTRLLDFTQSFYVAAFFALEQATGDSAIWAVNAQHLSRLARQRLRSDLRSGNTMVDEVQNIIAQDIFESAALIPLVLQVDPKRMNERQAVQQGVFLMAGSLERTFQENVSATFAFSSDLFDDATIVPFNSEILTEHVLRNTAVMKVVLPRSLRRDGLEELWRMNVTAASLFPGLDGFARSLHFYPVMYCETTASGSDAEPDGQEPTR